MSEEPKIKGLRRHYNSDITTKTELNYPGHVSPNGLCSICIGCGKCEVGLKAKTGRVQYPKPFGKAQFGSEKRLASLKDLQILPELYGRGIFFTEVNTETEIGGFKCKAPITMAALGSTKVASGDKKSNKGEILSKGAAKAGIVRVIGENVYATFGKNGLKSMIESYTNAKKEYGGIIVQANYTDQKLAVPELAVELGAEAIELKYGQGAKQGLGGEIQFKGKSKAKKYEKMGYLVLEHGKDKYERHVYPGDISEKGLKKTLKKYSKLGVPLWIKIGIGKGIEKFLKNLNQIKKEHDIPIECVTIDGHGGGTGMSPWALMNETGVPSASILRKKYDFGFDLLLAGGFNSGADIAKGMMLGSDGIAIGRAMLIAANTKKEEGIVNFVEALNEELKMFTTILREKDVNKIKNRRSNLLALSSEANKMFNITEKIENIL